MTTTRVPNFRITQYDAALIRQIASRALTVFRDAGVRPMPDLMDVTMDVTATHTRCPLRLEQLLAADDFHFAHDLFGIRRHMNRETGDLDGRFLPRYAR